MNFSATFEGHPIICNAMSYAWSFEKGEITISVFMQQQKISYAQTLLVFFLNSSSIPQERKCNLYFVLTWKPLTFLKRVHTFQKLASCQTAPRDFFPLNRLYLLMYFDLLQICITLIYICIFWALSFKASEGLYIWAISAWKKLPDCKYIAKTSTFLIFWFQMFWKRFIHLMFWFMIDVYNFKSGHCDCW